MEDVLDLIGADESASDISDKIKDVLYDRASSKIDGIKPTEGASMFDDSDLDTQEENNG